MFPQDFEEEKIVFGLYRDQDGVPYMLAPAGDSGFDIARLVTPEGSIRCPHDATFVFNLRSPKDLTTLKTILKDLRRVD